MGAPHWRMIIAALVVAVTLCGGTVAAMASVFDPAQVIQLLKQEIAAADRAGDAGAEHLQIEGAVLDLDLVELAGKAGSRLMVPGSDFGAGKDETAKSALRRRLVVDLASAGATKPAIAPETASNTADQPAGPLARALADLRSRLYAAVESPPAWDLKRLSVELDFILERDGKGGVVPAIFTAGRPIEATNVQKLKVRFSLRSS